MGAATTLRRFDGRVAVITGAGSGIGRATALRLGDEGATVAVFDIRPEAAAATADMLREAGIQGAPWGVDVSDDEAVNDAIAGVVEQFGRLDVLHNNAGTLVAKTTLELDVDEWDEVFAVNLRGMFSCTRASLPHLLATGKGAIVNTASIGGYLGVPNAAAYAASKGGVINYTRQLAADFTRNGVRANSICPGWVPTGFNAPVLEGVTEDDLATILDSTVPEGRQADPAEIASVVAFLASDDASYVSGHAMVVDGGLTAVM